MADDGWRIADLDLAAYLAAVGVPERAPSLVAFTELYGAHMRTFPFENFDVLLAQHPGVALAAVQDKFVGRGRGGYCFEHSVLLGAALERLGYPVQRRLGRVGSGNDLGGRTHMTLTVTIDDQQYLADPGFGMGPVGPMVMEPGLQQNKEGWQYQLDRVEDPGSPAQWRLSRKTRRGWDELHVMEEIAVLPVDVSLGHHYTSTHPDSIFVTGPRLARYGDGQHLSLSREGLTTRVPGQPTTRKPVTPDDLPQHLAALGIGLTAAELSRAQRAWPTWD